MNNKVEILAPCGDMATLKVAVANGANAVYLGLGKFNARMKAENFGTTLEEAVKYCHLFGVKVYVTLNTLVRDEEVSEWLTQVDEIVRVGVDAVIIQDFGMATLLRGLYPNLELHASTQMGIHNVEGAKFLEGLGFKRVVLARETTLEDIKAIRRETNLDIEYFVQGALCVAFSGNCYLSHYQGGGSGNRGECKQLCRLPYCAQNKGKKIGEGYFLSPADLCLIRNLKMLAEAGVTSFKIEGRLRRPGYVAVTTSMYRQVVDHNFNVDDSMIENLRQVFSRGEFNEEAYLGEGVRYPVINEKTNNHGGVLIGQVVWTKPFKNLYQIAIDTKHTLRQGDGLKLYRNGVEVASLGVGNVDKQGDFQVIYSTKKVQAGDKVNLTVNAKLEEQYIAKSRTLPITMECVIRVGIYPALTLCCGDMEVAVYGENVVQKANNHALTKEEVSEQLSKLNSDYFAIDNIVVELGNGCFLSKSDLNTLRREGLKALEEYILYTRHPKVEKGASKHSLPNGYEKINTNNIVVVNEKFGKDSDIILIAPSKYDVQTTRAIKDKYKASTYYLVLPIVANHKDIKVLDDLVESGLVDGVVIENYYGAKYIGKVPFMVGAKMNVYNEHTRDYWYSLGADLVFSNYECVLPHCGYINGYHSLMTFCHCPYQAVYHKTCETCPYNEGMTYYNGDKGFPIRRYRVSRCYFELLSDKQVKKTHDLVVEDMRC